MKVLGSFVDCVYEPHLYKEDIGDIRTKLISRLPDKRICEMASVLIIDTKYDMYVVKIRRPELNSSGCVDIKKTHKKIYETDFIEISKRDFKVEANKLITYLGGKDNIINAECNMSRLKVILKDVSLANKEGIQKLGAKGIVEIDNQLKIIFDKNAKQLKKYIEEIL